MHCIFDPVQAKELMVSDYQLVDIQSMSDDEIVQKKHLELTNPDSGLISTVIFRMDSKQDNTDSDPEKGNVS